VAQGAASGLTTYGYDPVGNRGGYTYPNGVQTSYNYDTLNRLYLMGAAKTTPLSSYTYTLGAAGNRKTVAELNGRTVQYGYDSLYRLNSETVTAEPANHNGLTTYTYDPVGNRQVLKINGVTVNTYNYDANDRLTSDVYDNDGNTTSSTGITNAYDFENHLIQHGAVTIVYDGDGKMSGDPARFHADRQFLHQTARTISVREGRFKRSVSKQILQPTPVANSRR